MSVFEGHHVPPDGCPRLPASSISPDPCRLGAATPYPCSKAVALQSRDPENLVHEHTECTQASSACWGHRCDREGQALVCHVSAQRWGGPVLFPASQYTSRLVNYFPNRKYDSGFGRWGGGQGTGGSRGSFRCHAWARWHLQQRLWAMQGEEEGLGDCSSELPPLQVRVSAFRGCGGRGKGA